MLPPSADPQLRSDSHLPDERLAELTDGGAPTAAEALHLERCRHCQGGLAVVTEIVAGARRELARVGVPLTDWSRLGPVLRAEGLMASEVGCDAAPQERAGVGVIPISRGSGRSRPAAARGRPWGSALVWRSAAAILLVAGGVAVGRVSAGAALLPGSPGAGGDGDPAARVAAILADSALPPASGEEAMAVLTRAERDYRMATSYLAASATPAMGVDRPEVYRRRLAVMDEVASLTRAALSESPHDPVLNQYYLASLGAREATLQSLASALPSGAQLSRF